MAQDQFDQEIRWRHMDDPEAHSRAPRILPNESQPNKQHGALSREGNAGEIKLGQLGQKCNSLHVMTHSLVFQIVYSMLMF